MNEVARSSPSNVWEITHVFVNHDTGYSSCSVLERSYHIPFTTNKVIEPHEGKHLFNILLNAFEHITKTGGMFV